MTANVRETLTPVSSTSGISMNTSAAVQVEDVIVVSQTLSNAAGAVTHAAAPGGTAGTWVLIDTITDTGSVGASLRVWYRIVTVAGVQNITLPANGASYNGQTVGVTVLDDVSITAPLDGTPTKKSNGAASTTIALDPITTTLNDSLLLAIISTGQTGGASGIYTPPSGMTEIWDKANGSNFAGSGAAWSLQTVAGSTGTKTYTSGSARHVGMLISFRNSSIPIALNDSATITETFGMTSQMTVTDTATVGENLSILSGMNVSDGASLAEQWAIYSSMNVPDSATVVDQFEITPIGGGDLIFFTDSATIDDAFGLTALVTVNDSMTLSETFEFLRHTYLPDSWTLTDSFALYSNVSVADTFTLSEIFSIIQIAATQVEPLIDERTYELIVVGFVPSASGPPSFVELDEIEWTGITYKDVLNAPQELTVRCKVSRLSDEVIRRLKSPKENPTELWVKRDGQIIAAGRLKGYNQNEGAEATVYARGLLGYLSQMRLFEDMIFVGKDQAEIVKGLVDTWQATVGGHFGIDTSRLVLTGRTLDISYLRNEKPNPLKVITDLGAATNGFDIDVDPASRQLTMWSPSRGTDRSSGESAIIFDDRNTTSLNIMCSVGDEDLVTDVFATGTKTGGEEPFFSHYSDAAMVAQYGRCAMDVTFSNVDSQETLDALTVAWQQARSTPLIVPAPKARVTDDSDLTQYSVGDTVRYDVEEGLGSAGTFRIRARTVTVDERGRESVDLEPF